MDAYKLLIDVGTGNTRVYLSNMDQKLVDSISFENKYMENILYQDSSSLEVEIFIDKLFESIKEVVSRNKVQEKISYLSVDSPRQSFALLDDNLEVIDILANIDNRGNLYLEDYLSRDIKDEVYCKAGHPITEDFGALKLIATKDKQPERYSKSRYFTSLGEWIAGFLTGQIVIEHTHAAETLLYNVLENKWDESLISLFGLDKNILPPIVEAGYCLGTINKDILDNLGINSDVNVIVGGADTQVAINSISNLEDGDIIVVSGTTSPIVKILSVPVFDSEHRIWLSKNLGGTNFMVETNPGVTGLNYQRMKQILAPNTSYEDLEQEYSKLENIRVQSCLTSQITAKLQGAIRGGFFIDPPSTSDITGVDLMYAILLDNVFSIYEKLQVLQENNLFINRIRACGGGFKSKTFAQALADITGLDVIVEDNFEMASISGLDKLLPANSEMITNQVNTKTYKAKTDLRLEKEFYLWKKRIETLTELNK